MSDLVDRLSVLQVLLAERHPDHHATVCEAIAEVRRLREIAKDFTALQAAIVGDSGASAMLTVERLRAREATARELATITVDTLDDLRADALRDEWSRWLETE